MRKILIAQPTRMHAHQLARAGVEAGYEVYFYSLLPDAPIAGGAGRWQRWFASRFSHNRLDMLPAGHCRSLVGPLALQKLTYNAPSLALSRAGEWAAWALFDQWVAGSLSRLLPDLVVGYERSAALTFAECRRLGIPCVLDAAAEHFSWQQQWLEEERQAAFTWAGRRLVGRKQQEIESASMVITCSPQSARSYIDAGVPPEKVAINPLGVDPTGFDRPSCRAGPPKFLFVGNPLPYKGLSRLIRCFEKIAPDIPEASLHVVGDTGRHLIGRCHPWLLPRGKLSHTQLAVLMSEMDYLVMPSRVESFGLVALEALASGMTLLISDRVGVGELLPDGDLCKKFSAEEDKSLELALRSACASVELTRSRDADARSLAAQFRWEQYHFRSARILEGVLSQEAKNLGLLSPRRA